MACRCSRTIQLDDSLKFVKVTVDFEECRVMGELSYVTAIGVEKLWGGKVEHAKMPLSLKDMKATRLVQ